MSAPFFRSIVLAFILVPSPAHAETSAEDLAACQRTTDPELQIALCTKVADSSSEIDDIRAEALLNRGLAHAAAGDDAKAFADYQHAIALNPDYSALYSSRGEAYVRAGELDKAIADFTTAFKKDPTNSEALRSRGILYLQKNRIDDAVSDFDTLVTLFADDADSYTARGFAYEQKGDTARAKADYRKALMLEGDNEIARSGLERLAGSF